MRRGFKHPLGSRPLPERMSDENLLRYYHFLRNANNAGVRRHAAHRIVMSHVRLGMSRVACFAVGSPLRTHDMVAEMLWGLVHACELISKGAIDHHETPNVSGYMMTTVDGLIRKMLKRSSVSVLSEHPTLEILDRRGGTSSEITEVINKSILSNQERRVIELRVEGFRDKEIGQMMEPKLTGSRVQQIRAVVRQRALEHINGLANS